MLKRGGRFLPEAAAIASLVLVVLALWLPVLNHYRVPKPVIADDVIEAARSSPPDELLQELGGFRFFGRPEAEHEQVSTAEQLLASSGQRPGAPFDPSDLERAQPLFVASFGVPRRLLAAYVITRREEFLSAARDYIVGWTRYEPRAWCPVASCGTITLPPSTCSSWPSSGDSIAAIRTTLLHSYSRESSIAGTGLLFRSGDVAADYPTRTVVAPTSARSPHPTDFWHQADERRGSM